MEYGSDFHVIDIGKNNTSELDFFGRPFSLVSSGRAALFVLLDDIKTFRKLWLPVYYCEDVVVSLHLKYGSKLHFYNDHPLVKEDALFSEIFNPGDVVIRINYFGLRTISSWSKEGVIQIHDYTHTLKSFEDASQDTLAFASLRKSLPLPDGGIINRSLEVQFKDPNHELLSWKRAFAMSLKTAYLHGQDFDKAYWRNLYLETECEIGNATASISEVSNDIMQTVDFSNLLEKKRRNLAYLSSVIPIDILYGELGMYENAFSLILNFPDHKTREFVKSHLIKNQFYPAVYWPFSDGYRKAKDTGSLKFSDTSLSIPADFRYDLQQLDTVIAVLKEVI